MELSAVQLSRLLGLERAAITEAYKNEKVLIRNSAKKFDTDNDTNRKYLEARNISKLDVQEFASIPSNLKPKRKSKNDIESMPIPEKEEITNGKDETGIIQDESPDELSEAEFEDITGLPDRMMNMTIKKLVRYYGGPMQLKIWADILNKQMMSAERDQRMRERRFELIEKDFVIAKIFNYLETLSQQLFDYPESIIDSLVAIVKSGKEENLRMGLIKEMEKSLGLLIAETKKNINRELHNMRKRHQDQGQEEKKEEGTKKPA
jgi:hypothetical protein